MSAFACDRTRVASLQWSRSFSMVRHTWLGSSEGHHTLSHDSNERPVLGAITHWYNQQLAYLLGELKKVPEGDGTLLDNTLVVYCNELHTGWDHKPGPVPTIVAGQLGGALKTGRLPRLRRRWPVHPQPVPGLAVPRDGAARDQEGGRPAGPRGPVAWYVRLRLFRLRGADRRRQPSLV